MIYFLVFFLMKVRIKENSTLWSQCALKERNGKLIFFKTEDTTGKLLLLTSDIKTEDTIGKLLLLTSDIKTEDTIGKLLLLTSDIKFSKKKSKRLRSGADLEPVESASAVTSA